MTRQLLTALIFSFCAGTVVTSQAEVLVREFSGSRSMETAEFEVEAPWLIDWRVNSEFPSSLGIAVALVEGGTGVHAGRVFKTKYPGNGVRLVNESGSYRFKIDSSVANWTIKVIQLTPEEAELYTPKDRTE